MNVAQIISLADTWGIHDDVGWGWMTSMMAVMVLFWGAVIFGIVWLIRSVARGGPAPSGETLAGRESPVQILERRFAEGALTLEDYRTRREVLVDEVAEPNGVRKGQSEFAEGSASGHRRD